MNVICAECVHWRPINSPGHVGCTQKGECTKLEKKMTTEEKEKKINEILEREFMSLMYPVTDFMHTLFF